MKKKDTKLVTNKELTEDFKKIDKLESEDKKKKQNNNTDKPVTNWTEEFSFDENDIDNNLI